MKRSSTLSLRGIRPANADRLGARMKAGQRRLTIKLPAADSNRSAATGSISARPPGRSPRLQQSRCDAAHIESLKSHVTIVHYISRTVNTA